MADNNKKVSNNIHYEITQSDYNLLVKHAKQVPELQQVLSRARAVQDDKTPVVQSPSPAAPVGRVRGPDPVVKEQPTDDVLKRVLGENYGNAVVYNYKTQTLSPKQYNGQEVLWNKSTEYWAKELKKLFMFHCAPIELVAYVTMQVAERDYPGFAKWTQPGKFVESNKNGCGLVGNLIIEEEPSKGPELLNKNAWLGFNYYADTPGLAAQNGANDFACAIVTASPIEWELFVEKQR